MTGGGRKDKESRKGFSVEKLHVVYVRTHQPNPRWRLYFQGLAEDFSGTLMDVMEVKANLSA